MQGIAWDLREMGSAQRRWVREGQAPQGAEKISSQLPARKEATWGRKKKEGRVRRYEEGPAHTDKYFQKGIYSSVITCNIVRIKIMLRLFQENKSYGIKTICIDPLSTHICT
jgi:hypothetical protein